MEGTKVVVSPCKVTMTPHFHVRASEGWYTDVGDGALSGVTVGNSSKHRLCLS